MQVRVRPITDNFYLTSILLFREKYAWNSLFSRIYSDPPKSETLRYGVRTLSTYQKLNAIVEYEIEFYRDLTGSCQIIVFMSLVLNQIV